MDSKEAGRAAAAAKPVVIGDKIDTLAMIAGRNHDFAGTLTPSRLFFARCQGFDIVRHWIASQS